jgi:glucose-1-phosphate thymidylyltransferase
MKALILAAGYATRLYPLTENTPKPLIKVADITILDHIIKKVDALPQIDQIYIVTNDKFNHHFISWLRTTNLNTPCKVLNDGSKNNEDRLGAVGDIHFTLNNETINDDLLVIAGDNLFGFELSNFTNFFNQTQSTIVAFHDLKDIEKVRNKFGVGILNGTKILNFEEKPSEPKSALASTACYLFHKNDLHLVSKALQTKNADNPGDLLKYIAENSQAHGFVFNEHWFDIGALEQLEQAEKLYSALP